MGLVRIGVVGRDFILRYYWTSKFQIFFLFLIDILFLWVIGFIYVILFVKCQLEKKKMNIIG